MMLDLGPFSDENFDRKKWVNSACQSRHPQDSVDKHLADLEMKIQMVSEEIGASLEEQSASSLLRVPRATREVIRLRDDAVSLRSAVSSILEKLKKAEGLSAESIMALAKYDIVKQRMEAAYETLQIKMEVSRFLFASHKEHLCGQTCACLQRVWFSRPTLFWFQLHPQFPLPTSRQLA